VDREKVVNWTLAVCLLVLIAFGVMFYAAIKRVEEVTVAAHIGHEKMHATMHAELETAEPGDLVALDDEYNPLVFLHAWEEDRRDQRRINDKILWFPPDAIVGAPVGQSLSKLIQWHPRLIKKGTPEYSEALTEYFIKKYYSH